MLGGDGGGAGTHAGNGVALVRRARAPTEFVALRDGGQQRGRRISDAASAYPLGLSGFSVSVRKRPGAGWLIRGMGLRVAWLVRRSSDFCVRGFACRARGFVASVLLSASDGMRPPLRKAAEIHSRWIGIHQGRKVTSWHREL